MIGVLSVVIQFWFFQILSERLYRISTFGYGCDRSFKVVLKEDRKDRRDGEIRG